MSRARLVTALLVAAAACTPPEVPPEVPRPPTDAELAVGIMQAYAAWQSEPLPADCAVYFSACADAFTRRAGFDPRDLSAKNPRSFMQNPDPTWIPGWDQIPPDSGHRHVAFAALTHAATMRAFFTSCRKEFDAADLTRAEESRRLEAELEGIDKLTNPYARLGRLVTYRRELKRRFEDPVGPRYALELAVFDRFSKAGRSFLYELQNQRTEDAALLRLPFAPEDERDLACIGAGIPTWQDPEAIPLAHVTVPIPAERAKALLERAARARDLESKLPAAERKLVEVTEADPPDKGAEIFLGKEVARVSLAVVQVKETKDGVLVYELAGKRVDKDVKYDCRATDKIEEIKDGKPVYAEECKRREEARDIHVTVRLPERPDVTPQKGDNVTLMGKITKIEVKRATSQGKHATSYKLEVDSIHVFEIWRDRLLVADYFVQ